jgi:hypothetical protein
MGELHPFSSGVLVAYPGLIGSDTLPDPTQTLSGSPLTTTRTVNSGALYADDPAAIVDGNAGTACTLNSHTSASPATGNDWFDVDTGSPYTYTTIGVTISNQGADGNTLNVWAADAPGSQPGGAGTALLAMFAAVTGTNTITLAGPVQGRHLLMETVNEAASSITVSEITATVYSGIPFAVLQSVTATHKTAKKDLYGPAWVSIFPIDVGFHSGEVMLEAEIASISAAGLRKVIASTEASATVDGLTILTETLGKTAALPSFAAVLQTQDTDGVSQLWHFPNCRAPGVNITAKKDDFAMAKFQFCAYPDQQGVVAYHQLPR